MCYIAHLLYKETRAPRENLPNLYSLVPLVTRSSLTTSAAVPYPMKNNKRIHLERFIAIHSHPPAYF